MRSVSILSFAGLVALAAAQPAVKRDMVTVTEIVTKVKTVDVTSTIYADAGAATPSPSPSKSVHVHHPVHQHPHPKPSETEVPTNTFVPPVQSTETPIAAPTTPVTTPTPEPAPTTTKKKPAPAPTSTKAPTGGAPANSFSGDMTYYAPGLGSCGETSSSSDSIVALAVPMMNNGANPNDNPKCGQTITIEYNGQQHQATVLDTCYACAMEDIDLSPTLFNKVDPTGDGRVSDVKWWFNDASFM